MGTPPPAGDRYQLVLILLENGYGGLEHDHGTVLHYSWAALEKPEGYRQLLQLIGHEYCTNGTFVVFALRSCVRTTTAPQ